MTRKMFTLAAITTLALVAGTAFAHEGFERERVTVRTADHDGGHRGVVVQEVRHPGHGYYGRHGWYGGPVVVHPQYIRPYPGPPAVIVVPPQPAPVYVPEPRGGFYYSGPRLSIGIGL